MKLLDRVDYLCVSQFNGSFRQRAESVAHDLQQRADGAAEHWQPPVRLGVSGDTLYVIVTISSSVENPEGLLPDQIDGIPIGYRVSRPVYLPSAGYRQARWK